MSLWWLLALVGACATDAQNEIRLTSFPRELTLEEAQVPQPVLPFAVAGTFQTAGHPALTDVVLLEFERGGFDGITRGMSLWLDEGGRLELRVSHQSAPGHAALRSQQVGLGDGAKHEMLLDVGFDEIRLTVDGQVSTAPRTLGTCIASNSGECTFSDSWLKDAKIFVGGSAIFDGSVFKGQIEFSFQRSPPVPGADVGGATPQQLPDDDETLAERGSKVSPGGGVGGDRDTTMLIIVVVLSTLLFSLCVAVAGACIWRVYAYRRSNHQPNSIVGNGQTAPNAIGKTAQPQIGAQSFRAREMTAAPSILAPEPPPPSSTIIDIPDPNLPSHPAWWTARPRAGISELVPVSSATREAVQDLMDTTWRGIVTRDRALLGSGSCVQRFQVVQVNRNENLKLWQEYVMQRNEIRGKVTEDCILQGMLTAEARAELGATELGSNEFLLWHGTKPSACASICQQDFLFQLCGSHRGTLYGDGLYFAESASKSDEYADDDKEGPYKGLYAMLLCRVTLGRALCTAEAAPDASRLRGACSGPSAEYDSVLGDREKARGTYREFVVYNGGQAYPEYVVIYRREAEAEATAA